MTREIPETHILSRWFRGLTEQTFAVELGIADPPLVGYVADLLTRFVPSSEIWKIHDPSGKTLGGVADMVAEAEAAEDAARRCQCHKHVGDFTLFWTGVFPEAVAKTRGKGGVDQFVDYCRQGKRSYYLASTMEDDKAQLLRRLSEEFELCAFGLSKVRVEWQRRESDAQPGAFLG
jgi:hypothetical protein